MCGSGALLIPSESLVVCVLLFSFIHLGGTYETFDFYECLYP